MKAFAYFALIASCSAIRLDQSQKTVIENHGMHACDFVDDNGEEISTSLMPEYVQLSDEEPQEEAPAAEEAAQVEETPAEPAAEEEAAVEEAPAPKRKGKKVEHVQVTEARNLMANVNADMEMATAKVEQEAAARTKAFALSQQEPDSE